MKCGCFTSWLLVLASTQAQESRSLLRSGKFEKARFLQAEWESDVSRVTSNNDFNHNVILAGIVHHGAEISINSLNFVLQATCVEKVRAHILGADDMEILSAMYNREKQFTFPDTICAPLMVTSQPDYITADKNRIDRIQAARDFQRTAISEQFDFADADKATIILADLDVNELPPLNQVINNAHNMNSRLGMNADVLCSSGKMLNPYGYYDTFATILLPDTFVYPVNGRPSMTARAEENTHFILGNNFTAHDLLEWFHKEGGADANPVRVKSCFGGLTIYRASTWLDQRCSYQDYNPVLNAKYANRYDNAACEHVVLHNCLQSVDPNVMIAVQPDMHTIWHSSSGPQYALSNHHALAAEFILEHLGNIRSSRRLQVSNTTFGNSTYVNTTFSANTTFFNSSLFNSTNATFRADDIPQWIVDQIFNSSFVDLNCNQTNTTNSSDSSNYTITYCPAFSPEQRMARINELIRFLYEGPIDCTNSTTNCTNSTPIVNDFIQMIYDDNYLEGNATNTTNATLSANTSTIETRDRELDAVPSAKPKLDFVIAGFPKCGTTSLLYAFYNNSETSIGRAEHCTSAAVGISDDQAYKSLDVELSGLSQDPSVKRGIKCPVLLSNVRSLDRLDRYAPDTKMLIGIRHPVKYFQSYYNYRVTECYDHNLPLDGIPPMESLIGKNEWYGVSTDSARFELYLQQLGKTEMSVADFRDMTGRPHLAVKPNNFKIFLYTLSQMEDETQERKSTFREQMRHFLGLQRPLPEVRQMNKNNFIGKRAHKETVDICDAKYDAVRALLVEQGKTTQKWIREEFIQSPDVVVGNKDHFLDMLDTWSHDPCREYLDESVDGTGSVWKYIQSFMAPFFDLIASYFS